MNTISQLETTCSNAINEMLFNTGGGSTSAWQSLVADYQAGDYVSTDTVALAPSSVQAMQLFLSYWGTLQYQQAVMTNDYFNYLASVLNTPAAATQSAYMAGWSAGPQWLTGCSRMACQRHGRGCSRPRNGTSKRPSAEPQSGSGIDEARRLGVAVGLQVS
jgi:hypothetical protein